MLQRIQSIYLFLATITLFALFIVPLVHDVMINGHADTVFVTGVYETAANGQQTHIQTFLALEISTFIVALLPLVILFRFKNRAQQIALCYSTMLVIIGFSFWVSQTVKTSIHDSDLTMSNYGIGIILLSISIVFVLLAQKAIQRDEKLVKSADRLR